MSEIDLAVKLGSLTMKNPVTTASGTFGNGLEYIDHLDITRLGALTLKAVTSEPRLGNSGQRLIETPSGVINSIGLMNPGVEVFCAEILPELRQYVLPLIVNIGGSTVSDYAHVAERLDHEPGITALEVNISCPNVAAGGMVFGTDAKLAAKVTSEVRAKTSLPLFVKLTPNVTDIAEIARAVEAAGGDGFSLINTLLAMDISIASRRPILDNVFGGLSGPAIRPIALRMVYQVHRVSALPIIGMGGITTWEDALKFILAGASAVAVGTANLSHPQATLAIIAGLEEYCRTAGVSHIADLIGAAHHQGTSC